MSDYGQRKNKYWYFFPHHVVRFFLEEWREERKYRLGLSKQEKCEFSNRIEQQFISFCFSFLLHFLLCLGLVNGVLEGLLASESEESVSLGEAIVNVELMGGMFSGHIKPIYDPKSDIVIKAFSLNRYKVYKKMTVLEKLLEQLGNQKISLLSKISNSKNIGSEKISKSRLALVEKNLQAGLSFGSNNSRSAVKKRKKIKQTQLWNRVNLTSLNKMRGGMMKQKDLMKVIDKHIFYFRECYEQALLRDEALTVNAHFLLRLQRTNVRSAKVNLIGKGGVISKKKMSNCLVAQSKKLHFTDNKQNLSVKFSLIFGL